MSNFSPKLQDATDEQLMNMINELDFRVVPLASDELTRRTLRNLHKTIAESNTRAEKIQMIMVWLTAMGTFIVVYPTLKTIFQWLSLFNIVIFPYSFKSFTSTDLISLLGAFVISSIILWLLGRLPSEKRTT